MVGSAVVTSAIMQEWWDTDGGRTRAQHRPGRKGHISSRIPEIVAVLRECSGYEEAGKRFGVSPNAVFSWGKRYPEIRKAIHWARKKELKGKL